MPTERQIRQSVVAAAIDRDRGTLRDLRREYGDVVDDFMKHYAATELTPQEREFVTRELREEGL